MSELRPSSSRAKRSNAASVDEAIRMNERRSMVFDVNNVGHA